MIINKVFCDKNSLSVAIYQTTVGKLMNLCHKVISLTNRGYNKPTSAIISTLINQKR